MSSGTRTFGHRRTIQFALMTERGWEALRLRDICERAKIGRSTFYTHFADEKNGC